MMFMLFGYRTGGSYAELDSFSSEVEAAAAIVDRRYGASPLDDGCRYFVVSTGSPDEGSPYVIPPGESHAVVIG